MDDRHDPAAFWSEIAASSEKSMTILDSPARAKQLLDCCHQFLNHATNVVGATPYELRWMAANISVRVNEPESR